jgi:hypothetical protein
MHERLGRIDDGRRILRAGAVGVARSPSGAPFYIRFENFVGPHGKPGFEATFNPEYVSLGGDETDVFVRWDVMSRMERYLSEFLEEFHVELCPIVDEPEALKTFFGRESLDVSRIDIENPWKRASS